VLVHELGHSLVAIRHGVRVRDILLWPLGGVARLERLPDSPRAELLIAVAGPLVNFTILAILTPILLFREAPFPSQAMIDGAPTLFEWFVLINIAMGTFNLIPAFPLDGGRVLRALLSPRFGIVKATCAAVVTGRLLAVVAAVAALSDIELVSLGLLGAFVWIFGGLELRATMLRTHATAWGARELSTGDIAVPIWKNVAP
jgi:Zn-dependent protease